LVESESEIFDFWRVKKNCRTGSMFEGEGSMYRFALVYFESPVGNPDNII